MVSASLELRGNSAPDRSRISRPSLALAFTEVPRTLAEMALLPLCAAALSMAPRGKRHPVLVLPGFLTSDTSTAALRCYIGALGYETFPWELGRNLGIRSVGETGERILERLMEIHRTSGEKVSLVGWSLGGIIARQMARQATGAVRQVITLGSPFSGDPSATNVTRLYEYLTGDRLNAANIAARLEVENRGLPVPSTAIFSRQDGITAWENCLDPVEGQRTENIEIYGSHLGLPFNPAALYVIADRLAQTDDRWSPFDRSGIKAFVYPSPD